MATWIETTDSFAATIHRKGKRADSTVKQNFRVFNAASDTEVHAEANNRFSGAFYTVGDYTLMVETYEITCVANGVFDVSVTYVKAGADADDANPLSRTRSFETGGATARQTFAIGPVPERRYGTNAPDMKGAVNVKGENVDGVDIVIPSLNWSETYDVPNSYVSAAYIKTIAQMTGTVNTGSFRTFAAGEVLFLGASGSQEWDTEKGDGPWRLTYKFTASPNAGSGETWPALEIGDVTGIEKKGQDFLWVRYEGDVQENTFIQKPKHVYVNQVYRRSNFSSLGIGTA